MPEYCFKACRLLLSNVWHKELTLVQRRILGVLRGKKRLFEREISRKENTYDYIRLQTTRRLALLYGNIRMREMRKARGDNKSYIPFLLHLECRLDVLLVRIHFCKTLAEARQLISHGKICVNHGIVRKMHWNVSPGSIISFKEDEDRRKADEETTDADDEMQVAVKTQTGKTILLDAKISDTIGSLKAKLEEKEGIPVDEQFLVLDGERLKDGSTLGDSCAPGKWSKFHLVLR